MGDTPIPAQSEAALWSRIVRPERDDLPAEAAKATLELDFAEADRARMHELVAARWRCGLSATEEAELETYCRVGQLLDLMHEKVRRSLGRGPDGDTSADEPPHDGARAEEKRRSREEDRLLLLRGERTRDDLRRENGLFAFPHVCIDLDGAEALA